MGGREEILPNNAEFAELSDAPSDPGVQPVIGGNRTITSVPQAPDMPEGNVPVEALRHIQRGAYLLLQLGRVVLVLEYKTLSATMMALRLW